MIEVGLAEYFGMGEALGIIGTFFVILYFSRKQTQKLSVDIETKVLNDLAQRMHVLHQILIESPQLIKVVSKVDTNSPEVAYAYDILFTFAHVFHMRQRKVLSDNEWTGWLRWMKSAFEQGEIREIWESAIEMEKWFDPAFQQFVDKELIPRTPKNKRS
ncbi:MAG TPA: hypothetical protein VFP25_06125 [Nitrososphaeraceae archaeon]|nr:hypothetical protein [Nitrososphaeraceae archaeon]